MTRIQAIEERLSNVAYLIPEKYAPMLEHLLDDCKYLLKVIKDMEAPDDAA